MIMCLQVLRSNMREEVIEKKRDKKMKKKVIKNKKDRRSDEKKDKRSDKKIAFKDTNQAPLHNNQAKTIMIKTILSLKNTKSLYTMNLTYKQTSSATN
jgi:hypothetical protein